MCFEGSQFTYLLGLSITMLLGRMLLFLGETNTENSQEVSISSLDINVSLNQGLPFLNHGAEFISGQIHSIELCQAVFALHIFARELELLIRSLSVL